MIKICLFLFFACLVFSFMGGFTHAIGDWYQDDDGNWYNHASNTPGKDDFGDNKTIINTGGIYTRAPGVMTGIQGGSDNIVINHGSIKAAYGIYVDAHSRVVNHGVIIASSKGVSLLEDGNTFINHGTIVAQGDGMRIGIPNIHLLRNLVINYGTIEAGENGIDVDGNNRVENHGTIISEWAGIDLDRDNNTVINHGHIRSTADSGIGSPALWPTIHNYGNNRIENHGTIISELAGIDLGGDNNTVINHGLIQSRTRDAVRVDSGENVLTNSGILIGADGFCSVLGGTGDDRVNATKRPKFKGMIDGNTGNDTLMFHHMKGINRSQARALASANPAGGSIRIQGETCEWQNFESIESDKLLSYERDLIDDPGLKTLGHKLDHLDTGVEETTRQGLIFVDNADSIEETEARLCNITGMGCSNMTAITAVNSTSRVTEQLNQQLHQLRLARHKKTHDKQQKKNRVAGRPDFHLNSRLVAYSDTNRTVVSDAPGFTLAQAGKPAPEDVAVDSTDTTPTRKWHGFVTMDLTRAKLDTAFDPGDYMTSGVALGTGYLLKDWMTLGMYAGIANTSADIDPWGSDLDADASLIGLYTMMTQGSWFLNGLAGYTYYDYDLERVIPGAAVAVAGTRGDQYACALKGGYDWFWGEQDQWILTPQLGVQYVMLDIDDYNEQGAGSLNLYVEDQTVYSLRSDLGLQISRLFQADWGSAEINLNGSWIHEFRDEGRGITIRFNDSALGTVRVRTEEEDDDFGIIGLGINAKLNDPENVEFNLTYQTHVGHEDFESHNLELELRMLF